LRASTVARLDVLAAEEPARSRSQVIRELLAAGFEARSGKSRRATPDITPIQPAGRPGHVLSDAEWKVWLWLNDLAEKSYLGGAPIKIGRNIDGLRFRLEPITDPDLEIP
jgi:hypothetical protein